MYDEDRGDFWPHNSPDNWYGVVSVSFAIQKSLNTVATATAQKLGVQECFDFLTKSLGFTTLIDRKEINGQVYSDIAISPISHGAFTEGVTVLEVTQGYTMFANDGMVSGAKFFTMIRDSNDEIIIDNKGTENQTYAVSEQTAYIMTSLLRNVVELGTGTAEYAFEWYRTFDSEVEVGGKTGQTNEDRDRYFVGFTPDFTAAVWFGYDNNKSLSSTGITIDTGVDRGVQPASTPRMRRRGCTTRRNSAVRPPSSRSNTARSRQEADRGLPARRRGADQGV